jgi:hypothetical protein
MKTKYYSLLLLLLLIGSSCERTIDFDGPDEETANDMVINALAVADGQLTVFLNRAYLVDKAPSQYFDYEHAVLAKDEFALDYSQPFYSKRTAITNAQVTAVVNGGEEFELFFDGDELSYYNKNYVPQVGDHIVVTATQDKNKVTVETTVPPTPKIEVVNYEILDENPYQEVNGLINPADTIMRLTCRIIDAGGMQYYRLRVRSEGYGTATTLYQGFHWYVMQDVFFSDDELFVDHRITSNFGGWPAFFSNIFDNSQMKGGSYTFTIDALKAKESLPYRILDVERKDLEPIPSRVMLELQAITPDFYRYLKSVQLFRVASNDAYSEPVQIYSNAIGGWGILGSLSYDRHYIAF